MGIPSTAVRNDWGILLTLAARYPGPFFRVILDAKQITAPFDLDEYGVKDSFLRNYLDLIAFLLQGLPADQTLTAVMAYMVEVRTWPPTIDDLSAADMAAMHFRMLLLVPTPQ